MKRTSIPSDHQISVAIYILDTHSTNDCIHNFGLNFLFELSYPIGILYNSKFKKQNPYKIFKCYYGFRGLSLVYALWFTRCLHFYLQEIG